jgi:hypothetical protein
MELRNWFLGAVVFFASFAFAQSDTSSDKIVVPTADQSSTISATMIPNSIMDRLFLDYFTYYHGPSLSDLKSANSIDNKGRPSAFALSGLDSDVNLAYIVDKERGIGIGPDVPFVAQPTHGGQFALGDAGLKIFWKKIVATENFRFSSALYLQGDTSDSSRARGMDFGIKLTPYLYYDVPDSRFRLGSWLEFKWYGDVKVDKILKAWASPYVSYRLHERFLLNMNYEMEAHHNVDNDPMQFISYQTDLQPGFIWWVTKHTMINPYVQIFTNVPIATYSSGLGFVLYSALM